MAIEEPKYVATLHVGRFEVRSYSAMTVAEVVVDGSRDSAARAGFRLLAAYIFGGNRQRQSIAMMPAPAKAVARGERIAMTAPVTQMEQGGGWIIRFTMPQGYSLESLPVPVDPRVRLIKLPPAQFAVVRFSGLCGEKNQALMTAELRGYAATHGLDASGDPVLARYDSPWTLWFMRRNEVMLPIRDYYPMPAAPALARLAKQKSA